MIYLDPIVHRSHVSTLAIRAEGFLEKVRFYSRLILNADETHLLDGQ